jgi:hypothetical protein
VRRVVVDEVVDADRRGIRDHIILMTDHRGEGAGEEVDLLFVFILTISEKEVDFLFDVLQGKYDAFKSWQY